MGLGRRQGLTLVHFSAQPEPLTLPNLYETTQCIRKECSRPAGKWTSVRPWTPANTTTRAAAAGAAWSSTLTLGRAVKGHSLHSRVESVSGFSSSSYNMRNCFRVLLSNPTCAATSWLILRRGLAGAGVTTMPAEVGSRGQCSPRHRIPFNRNNEDLILV